MRKAILFVCILLSIKASAQLISISPTEIDKYMIDKAGYKNDTGEYYGAGHIVDAYNIIVSFKEILFEKRTKNLTIKGTTYGILIDSTSRLNGTGIFTARPKRKKLEERNILGYSTTSHSGANKDGDFVISFQVKKNTNLYFEGGKNYFLLEFKMWDLVSSIK